MILETFSGLGDAANSPFIVPVAGCLMVLGIVGFKSWSRTRRREMESQERLAAIARGITPPPTTEEVAISSVFQGHAAPNALRRRANSRQGGVVLCGTAVGLILFFIALATVLQERDVLSGAAVGLIPLGIGVGLLIDARIQSREIDEASSTADSASSITYPPRSIS